MLKFGFVVLGIGVIAAAGLIFFLLGAGLAAMLQ